MAVADPPRAAGYPVDPTSVPFEIDPVTGVVSVSRRSQLFLDASDWIAAMTADTVALIAFGWLGLSVGSF